MAHAWNCHRLQRHRNMIEPSGKPIIMYTSPELYNTEEQLVQVDPLEVEVCTDQCVFNDGPQCRDLTVFELCCAITVDLDLTMPEDADEAVHLYRTLRDVIHQEM